MTARPMAHLATLRAQGAHAGGRPGRRKDACAPESSEGGMSSAVDSEEQLGRDIYALRRAGYAVIPNFLSAETVARLRDDALAFQQEVDEYRELGGDVAFPSGWPLRNVRALYAVSSAVQEVA